MVPGSGRARWGFHRLDDRSARRFAAAASVQRGDLVLDVGAGHGALTQALLQRGASVIAIELHPDRRRHLRRRFAGRPVTVVGADAADLRLPRRPFKVVANPPFASSVALLRRITAPGSRLQEGVLILPRPLARRWAQGRFRGNAARCTVYEIRTIGCLAASCFHPPPTRPTQILHIRRRTALDRASA